MRSSISFGGVNHTWKQHITQDRYILFLSVVLQLTLGVFFGHAYDMRIFMATGYLVGSGQIRMSLRISQPCSRTSPFRG